MMSYENGSMTWKESMNLFAPDGMEWSEESKCFKFINEPKTVFLNPRVQSMTYQNTVTNIGANEVLTPEQVLQREVARLEEMKSRLINSAVDLEKQAQAKRMKIAEIESAQAAMSKAIPKR
jgi:uncharacterized protein YaaN involved in tellurite resistance